MGVRKAIPPELRIFVSYPRDVRSERDRLNAVVEELNRTLAAHLKVTFRLFDWHTHVAPSMGRPQQVILEQLPVDRWDILVGILWHRFGMPTGGVNRETGEPFTSGTEEEFTLAYRAWKRGGRPRIFFYRCTRAVPPNEIDPEQLGRVNKFYAEFGPSGRHPGLVQYYETPDEFERLVREHLMQVLLDYSDEVKGLRLLPRPSTARMVSTRKLQPGRWKEVAPEFRRNSRTTAVKTKTAIRDVAEVAIKTKTLGAISAGIIEKIRKSIKEVTSIQIFTFDNGYLSPFFVTDVASDECVLLEPYILIHDKKIDTVKDIVPLLEDVARSGRPLMVMAKDVVGDALATLVLNKLRNRLQCCAVKPPAIGESQKAMLEGVAKLTGYKMLTTDQGSTIGTAGLEHLGRAKMVVVDSRNTTLVL